MIIIIKNNSNINNKLSRYFCDANGALLGLHPSTDFRPKKFPYFQTTLNFYS